MAGTEAVKPSRGERKRAKARAEAGIGAFRFHTRVRWLFVAVNWNVFAGVLAPVAWSELAPFWWRGIVLILPAIGFVLGLMAARNYFRYRRDGAASMFLDPPAPRIGEPFQVRFVSAKPPAEGSVFQARIQCRRTEYGADDVSNKEIWAIERPLSVRDGIAALKICLPDDLPHSHLAASDLGYAWAIDLDRGGYRQEYALPIGPLVGSTWDSAEKARQAAGLDGNRAYTRARRGATTKI